MTDGRTRNGGQLLMDSLVALGATRGFGVPGESYLAVLDAMVDHANAFDLVLAGRRAVPPIWLPHGAS